MTTPKHAGVIAPPPLMLLAALVAGFVVQPFAPLGLLVHVPALARWGVGGLMIAAALAVNFQGFFRFKTAGTPVVPYQTPTTLVTDGVYAHVRNPMYLGMNLIAFGLGIALANDWLILFGIVLALALHYGVVRREERFLTQLFGDAYVAYMARTPRYGWKV